MNRTKNTSCITSIFQPPNAFHVNMRDTIRHIESTSLFIKIPSKNLPDAADLWINYLDFTNDISVLNFRAICLEQHCTEIGYSASQQGSYLHVWSVKKREKNIPTVGPVSQEQFVKRKKKVCGYQVIYILRQKEKIDYV